MSLYRYCSRSPPCPFPPDSRAIADSGSTAHFCTVTANVINKRLTSTPIGIANPNGTVMYSTHEAELDLPGLPLAARRVHIVPALTTDSLLSMGQLCDAGCIVTFDATGVQVRLNNVLLLSGTRTPESGLWHLTLDASAPCVPTSVPASLLHHSYAALHSATPAELVAFAHAALFSPALSTLQRAVACGYLPNFMGLTSATLRRHPPTSVPMIKGHMDQARKNQHSTKPATPIDPLVNPSLALTP